MAVNIGNGPNLQEETVGSRVQLALNVTDIDRAVEFYSRLFAAEPAKRRPGYANFAIAEPPLKLVLIEASSGGSLNHLGVEVESAPAVAEATARLADEGLATRVEESVDCCYAVQDKVWVQDPDGAPWEVYTVLSDSASAASCCEDGTCACNVESAAEGQVVSCC